jgi:hypothetical protein
MSARLSARAAAVVGRSEAYRWTASRGRQRVAVADPLRHRGTGLTHRSGQYWSHGAAVLTEWSRTDSGVSHSVRGLRLAGHVVVHFPY